MTLYGSGESRSALRSAGMRWMSVAAVMLAFALRVWRVDDQSLRGDEAFDVAFVQRSVSDVLRELRISQPYPPAFYLFFKMWVRLVGRSEFALRFPALWCGTAMVPLAYALSRLWCGERAAQRTAFLLAAQPLAIWYAQDGRMYAPLMLLSLASTCFAARLWAGRRSVGSWGGYVGVALLGLMTHYVAALVLTAHQLCGLVVAWRDRDRRFVFRWLGAGALTGVMYLPWVLWAWPVLRSHTSSWAQAVSAPSVLWRVLAAYTVGMTIEWRWALVPVLASVVCMAVACAGMMRSCRRGQLLFLALTIALPVVVVAGVGLQRPMFDERYLVVLVAPILTLVGRGLAELCDRRWAQVILAALVVSGIGISYSQYRFNPQYAKSLGWRDLFEALEGSIRAGDAVVYTFPDPAPEVYVDERWPVFLLPTSLPADAEEVQRRAEQMADTHQRIWLIPQWSPDWDAEGLVEEVLDIVCERAAEVRLASWPLVVYHTPRLYEREMMPLDATVGSQIELLGYVLRDEGGKSVDQVEVQPGAAVRLTLYWKAASKVGDDYVAFVHILDGVGRVHGQQDNQPRGGTYPTKAWTPGVPVVDVYHIPLSADAAEGDYALEVGMYRPGDGVRLATSGDDADPDHDRVLLRDRVRVP